MKISLIDFYPHDGKWHTICLKYFFQILSRMFTWEQKVNKLTSCTKNEITLKYASK